uniref:Uncharacterized protein n=1 Tax=Tanacetum cinerariifolium TaxID=118510 RepID=A0A6L2JZA6_TANCI|nr:hypothetical protein [Tanacetum cinerariifolium]
MYDSWKSIMELYTMNRQHGRMILKFVENDPLIWPTIDENGITRLRKYSELTHAEGIPVDCDDGRVTLQPVQGRQISFAIGTSKTYTAVASGINSRKQRTVICYNFRGIGLMSKQYTKPKRKWDDSWFKDKVLLVQAQANGQILHEEELAFLADLGLVEEVVYNSNSSTQQDALILSVIEQLKTQVINYTKINLDNKSVNDTLTAELERYEEKVKVLKEGKNVELKSQDNILDSCKHSVEIDRLK